MPTFKTNDGVTLAYTDTGGSEPVLLMLHGWSQSGAMFKHQVSSLREQFRVITLDFRGHGESEKTDKGYRIARLAKDVYDFIAELNLQRVTLLGWSMGCTVAWCYWDLFGAERLDKFVFVDQAPWLLPSYSIYEDEPHTLDCGMLDRLYTGLIGADATAFTAGFLSMMHTKKLAQKEVDWLLAESLKLPRKSSALMLLDHICGDWRCAIASINIPTLIIGGRASLIKYKTQEWIARQIPDARLEIFEEDEGGGHVMFLENPEKFNRLVREHVLGVSASPSGLT
jgi:non-heme chloroperoxidase